MSFKLWNFGVLGGEAQGNASIRKFSYLLTTNDSDTIEDVCSDDYFLSEKSRLLLNDIIEVFDEKDEDKKYCYLQIIECSLISVKTKILNFNHLPIKWGEIVGDLENQEDLVDYISNQIKWGEIKGDLEDQEDLVEYIEDGLNKKVNIQQGADNVGKILKVNSLGDLQLASIEKYEDDTLNLCFVLDGANYSINQGILTIMSGLKYLTPDGKDANNDLKFIENTLNQNVTIDVGSILPPSTKKYYVAINENKELFLIDIENFKINNFDLMKYNYDTFLNEITFNNQKVLISVIGLFQNLYKKNGVITQLIGQYFSFAPNFKKKVDIHQGIENIGKILEVDNNGDLELKNKSMEWGEIDGTLNNQQDLKEELDSKLNVNQGSENEGKFLQVDSNGDVTPVNVTPGSKELDYDNIQNLSPSGGVVTVPSDGFLILSISFKDASNGRTLYYTPYGGSQIAIAYAVYDFVFSFSMPVKSGDSFSYATSELRSEYFNLIPYK